MKRALITVMVAILTMPVLALAVPRVWVTNYTSSVISVWLFGQPQYHHQHEDVGISHVVYPNYSLELPDVDYFFRNFPEVFVQISHGPRFYPTFLPAQATYLNVIVQEGADGRLQCSLQGG